MSDVLQYATCNHVHEIAIETEKDGGATTVPTDWAVKSLPVASNRVGTCPVSSQNIDASAWFFRTTTIVSLVFVHRLQLQQLLQGQCPGPRPGHLGKTPRAGRPATFDWRCSLFFFSKEVYQAPQSMDDTVSFLAVLISSSIDPHLVVVMISKRLLFYPLDDQQEEMNQTPSLGVLRPEAFINHSCQTNIMTTPPASGTDVIIRTT